ncbi:phosphoribosylanthranilate isomerase [Paenibacillus turpanensis]|uniref:phosphoribosylanthranilate isomerase n=1 Tax=Paenibacillus turpanensis TaxID=2689078 RepID=UPI00140B3BB5|nr:phosphoribosylanthranilate isomerase [Paenibacillus turpanensis]
MPKVKEASDSARPTVKICGIRHPEILETLTELPVDYIGFVFAESKRRVTAEQAGELTRLLRSAGKAAGEEQASVKAHGADEASGSRVPKTVGVFVNPAYEELLHVIDTAGLDIAQLHGSEPPEFCSRVKQARPSVRLVKVLPVQLGDTELLTEEAVEAQLAPYAAEVDGFMLDTHDPVTHGGTGQAFSWDKIPPYLHWCRSRGIPLWVAGGLHADNVAGLIEAYGPDGVDVSSGVETDGVKDKSKVKQFVERVKRA